jgi:hypothetical protein
VWPLPNVWLGVSVENQKAADERIPLLLATPAAKRFISAEPLLGPLNLTNLPALGLDRSDYVPTREDIDDDWRFSALGAGDVYHGCGGDLISDGPEHPALDWVICGGESGPDARPMHPDWARGLRDQCAAAGVPFFFKQWGEWLPGLQFEDVHREADPSLEQSRFACMDWNDGKWLDIGGGWMDDPSDGAVYRVGKKLAGHLLDGKEWREFPS